MKNKKFLLILMLIALCIMPTTSKAALQSTKTVRDYKSDSATNWIINVRNMESKGGGMGLNETVESDGIATTEANGIDVHLQKNTEYGAAILLGASDYGKQGTVGGTGTDRWMNNGSQTLTGTDLKSSTTGNVTGIYELGISGYYDWTAAGGTSFLSNIAPRYRDIYETVEERKPGDALLNWHGSGGIVFPNSYQGFVRANGLVFSASFYNSSDYNMARACVVSYPGI